MQQGKRNQATSTIPERLDLQVMEERVRWINRAGLTEVESGQIGNIGKNLHMEQTEWSKQLDEVVQGAHVYMDQLMPQEINFENHDSFLSLESMAIPSSSFAQVYHSRRKNANTKSVKIRPYNLCVNLQWMRQVFRSAIIIFLDHSTP